MRATREASGWKIDEPMPINMAAKRIEGYVPARDIRRRPARVRRMPAVRESGWGSVPEGGRERRGERAELIVRVGPAVPHEAGAGPRPAEEGERVIPGAEVVGDGLARCRHEGHGARGFGASVGAGRCDDHEP